MALLQLSVMSQKFLLYLVGFVILTMASPSWAVFLGQEITISTGFADQDNPSVAYDSINRRFLVVWYDWRIGPSTDIYGQIIRADGTLLGGNFPISTAPDGQANVSISYDPTNHRFLAAWLDGRNGPNSDIYGQLINTNGTPFGGDFPISIAPNDQWNPSVAYDPATQRFLVVWWDLRNGPNSDIYGQLINANGSPFGGNLSISTAANGQYNPSVTYDSISQRFLVVWWDWRNGLNSDIYGQLINADGTPFGGDFPISTAANGQYNPSVAYDSISQRFLAVWDDLRNGPNSDIYGQLINGDGTLLGGDFSISTAPNDQGNPSVAYDSATQHFLVAWEDERIGTSLKIYGQFISTSGALFGENFSISTASNDQWWTSVANDPSNKRFLVVWMDGPTPSGYDIHGRIVSESPIEKGFEKQGCGCTMGEVLDAPTIFLAFLFILFVFRAKRFFL